MPQGQLEASRRDLQAAQSRAATAAQSGAASPQITQYLSVLVQQLQQVSGQLESAEAERDRLAAAHGRLVQTLERERGERERQAALAQQQVGPGWMLVPLVFGGESTGWLVVLR